MVRKGRSRTDVRDRIFGEADHAKAFVIGRQETLAQIGRMSSRLGTGDRLIGHRVRRIDSGLPAGSTLHDDVVTDRSHLHEEAETVDGQAEIEIRCV